MKVLCSATLAGRTNTSASCGISKRPQIHSLKEQIPRSLGGAPWESLSILSFPFSPRVPLSSSLFSPARSLFASHLKRSSPPGAVRKVNCQNPSVIVFEEEVCVCVCTAEHLGHFLTMVNKSMYFLLENQDVFSV